MADLTAARVVLVGQKSLKKTRYPLGANIKAVEGCMAVIDSANLGYVWSGKVATTLKPIGTFLETVDNTGGSSGALGVGVEFTRERWCEIWDSIASGGVITVASLFATVYINSNHELTLTSTGASIYGTVLGFGPQGYPNGVIVEPAF